MAEGSGALARLLRHDDFGIGLDAAAKGQQQGDLAVFKERPAAQGPTRRQAAE